MVKASPYGEGLGKYPQLQSVLGLRWRLPQAGYRQNWLFMA